MQGKGNDAFQRSQMYQQRVSRFLNKIKQYQNEEIKKIEQRGKDQIQFESNKILNQSHEKDTQLFGKKQKALEVQFKIKKSRKVNEARLSKMKMRFQMIQKVQNQIKSKLVESTSNGRQYRQLLQKLIMQGIIKMLQEKIEVKCLARDIGLIKQLIPVCEKAFGEMCQVQTKLTLSPQNLPQSDLGGVILTSFQGKIVCNNTLKARLQYAVQQSLPQVRRHLFTVDSLKTSAPTSTQNSTLI